MEPLNCERVRQQLESDSTDLTKLVIGRDYLPPDDDWERDGRSVGRNTNIKDLAVFNSMDDPENIQQFLSEILANRSIEKLSFYFINDKIAMSVAKVLFNMSTLKVLKLWSWGYHCTGASWGAIFGCLQSPNCTLEVLDMSEGQMTDDVMFLTRSLAVNNTLRELDLNGNDNVTATGWNAFFTILQGSTSVLEKLNLADNATINDEVLNSLTYALASNNKLMELDLSCLIDVTAEGWESFSAVLRSHDSALELLDLRGNEINDGVMIALADSLANNNKMRKLLLIDNFDQFQLDITADGWAAFARILCDCSSIMATYNSNHTLEKLHQEDMDDGVPEGLKSLMLINQENSKSQAARLKIIKTHFADENVNIQPFLRMELGVLPHAFAWALNDHENNEEGTGLDLAYEIMSRVVVPRMFGQQDEEMDES